MRRPQEILQCCFAAALKSIPSITSISLLWALFQLPLWSCYFTILFCLILFSLRVMKELKLFLVLFSSHSEAKCRAWIYLPSLLIKEPPKAARETCRWNWTLLNRLDNWLRNFVVLVWFISFLLVFWVHLIQFEQKTFLGTFVWCHTFRWRFYLE